ncbi:Transglutaminase-like superfamily protein [Trichlorobacter thiogenes]|uniref:Transglutaminase-like superfamily protein n=1 Tax=Trichlorobacter thiogenes TaxID=115783 RepID=A0A1T4K7N3_9BACT|nr:transglutaminase-like domain-containing protein [Trichlorobacter thiogenes]SJZ38421.1 Transglutaminase-like superfamily protein [Trichlorobacter thiogenes]
MLQLKRSFFYLLSAALAAVFLSLPVFAAAPNQLATPPLGERWFAILIDNEQVGFYHQQTTALPEGGYRIEGDGSVRMKVMGFTKESSSREIYQVGPNLALKTVEVEQTINGSKSRLSGKMIPGGLQIRREADGKSSLKTLKAKSELFPGPTLNLIPLFKGTATGKTLRVFSFDPEELAIKEVKITVQGEGKTPEGVHAFKLRNNLYPFVDNEIWLDQQGNTLLESVRDGLVITKAEPPEKLAAFVSGMALSKKDLIYDFSLVRINPPLKKAPAKLAGLSVAITGYGDQIPVLSNGSQQVERQQGRVVITTGSLRKPTDMLLKQAAEAYLQPSEGIESTSAEISAKTKELTSSLKTDQERIQALTAWTASWIEDSIEDGGSALTALSKKKGNCQTHAKLYSALARAAGIPTRFVSGLVSQDGAGFLYHSWAESLVEGRWIAVDPTFNQVPADPTHLAFFEGNRLADLSPLVGVIGKIKVTILEER